jgi:hypothetical protein
VLQNATVQSWLFLIQTWDYRVRSYRANDRAAYPADPISLLMVRDLPPSGRPSGLRAQHAVHRASFHVLPDGCIRYDEVQFSKALRVLPEMLGYKI